MSKAKKLMANDILAALESSLETTLGLISALKKSPIERELYLKKLEINDFMRKLTIHQIEQSRRTGRRR